MKKKIVLCFSVLFLFSISLPVIGYMKDTVSADTTLIEPLGEEVIDITGVYGLDDVFAITSRKELYHCKYVTCTIVRDEAGKPLQNVKQVEMYENSLALILLENDQVYKLNRLDGAAISMNTGLANIIDIACGGNNYFIVTSDGSLYANGNNSLGLLGNGSNIESSDAFVKVNIDDVKKVTASEKQAVALKNDGTVYAWGNGVFDGVTTHTDIVNEPIPLHYSDGTEIHNAVDISKRIGITYAMGFGLLASENGELKAYIYGNRFKPTTIELGVSINGNTFDDFFYVYGYDFFDNVGILKDNEVYSKKYPNGLFATYEAKVPGLKQRVGKIKKFKDYATIGGTDIYYFITETNSLVTLNDSNAEVYQIKVGDALKVKAYKPDTSLYSSQEKFNDDIRIVPTTSETTPITCKVQDPVGSSETDCTDFQNDEVSINLQNDRIYKKYIFTDSKATKELIVDLFKGTPQINGLSSLTVNKLKVTDIISLTVPQDQTGWNSYTATVTDSSNQEKDFTGGTLNEGTYTMHITDAYGNTQDYQIEVVDKPQPTAIFTSASASLTYQDASTKVNGLIGTFSLQYPTGKPTSTIASIQLGTGGDESHFSIDTTGALKVKGNDLNAGTYSVTISGKDGNQMDFTKTVQIVVGKANQDNYQITNSANYSFKLNQEISITTSGNESGERETYRITNGNTIAQISNTNKFKMLNAGTFTLEATVAGNNNYNSKTVTKQITLSQLPTQTNPIKISSGDSMMYGNTYTPTSTGGTGSGNVSWSIENDSGTGANLNNGSIKVTGIGTFTLKVTKAGDTNYQSSSDSKVITVNKRKTTVKPKDVTRKVGEAFKDNGVTYNPQPVSGDSLGTPIITSKYPTSQQAGRYTDGIQVTGLTNPNYDFEYQEGTLIINDTTLPNNGSGYYKITGTLGKNNWYVSDIKISTLNKDGYDQISSDGINFQTTPLIYQTDGDYQVTFYLKNSTTGIIAKGINYQVKIDQTPPTVPTLTMNQLNTSRMARLINFLSFGNWMNTGAEVIMSSTDGTSGIDNYSYVETDTKGTSNTKTSTTGKVTYQNDVEIGITAKACDKAGNCSDLSASETLMIDRKGPEITGVKDKSVYKYYYLPRFVKVKDNGSGLSYAEYLKDGAQAGTIQENVNERIDGVGKYEVYAIDNAGNESTLSFEIVPLPNIDDIDGSDESKDIIDQVKDEYEEVKDHLTDEERKEYEDWIKDAQDKWESERKKVIETDDKTSKVEGVGDTTFDPNLELIVDDITDQPLPLLPKKANVVYDVYLQKGNTKVEPDGSIKVYLPYTDNEDPIIYQIDENGKVTEIKAEKEGNYVTFITDELGKFAISNTAQPDNKDNMCVVGPDGKVETGDEVCGKPNDKGDQPTKKPDGSVEVPDGGKVEFPNGTEIDTPNGAIINPDGSVTLPDGTEYDPNGNIKDKDVCKLDGKDINIDTDDDGKPDVNIDIDGDCKPDINIDTDNDGIPNTNIDTDLDGKPDYNIDTDNDGKPNVNIGPVNDPWKPNTCGVVNEITFCTDSYKKPYLNIDSDGDGRPDINVDLDGDMEADINIDIDGDNIPDIDIDSDGDGKPDINVDTDNDGKADKNIVKITEWKPDKNVDGSIPYDTMSNVSSSNTDSNGNGNDSQLGANMGGTIGSAQTGDETKPFLWWIIVCVNICMMIYCYRKVRKEQEQES